MTADAKQLGGSRRLLWFMVLGICLNPFLLFDLYVSIRLGQALPGISAATLVGPLAIPMAAVCLLLPVLAFYLTRPWLFGPPLFVAIITLLTWITGAGFAFGAILDGLRLPAPYALLHLALLHLAWTAALAIGMLSGRGGKRTS
ncbi:hypothetical protein J4558_14655 [Leptolyngbya sp. 15MV]|nr:hypothetical protein J4558_14655 [Leptolyngbya sp. 15MV]